MHVDPRSVLFRQDLLGLSVRCIRQPEFVAILQSIQLLDQEFARVVNPVDARHIMIARIAR